MQTMNAGVEVTQVNSIVGHTPMDTRAIVMDTRAIVINTWTVMKNGNRHRVETRISDCLRHSPDLNIPIF